MNKIRELQPYSFVQRDFYWVAEYLNGTLFPEYDFSTYERNDFDYINRNLLIRFGYLGAGYYFYFDTPTGLFSIADHDYSFAYKVGDVEYELTKQDRLYNDIISYKSMYSDAVFGSPLSQSGVGAYHFGYKNSFRINDVNFHFKPIFHIPYETAAYFTVWLVSDKDLDGQLVIKKDGFKIAEIETPLLSNVGTEFEWVVY